MDRDFHFGKMTAPGSLIIGGDSQLGSSLVSHLREAKQNVISTVFSRDPVFQNEFFLDLSKDTSNLSIPGKFNIAFLCAAVTSTEFCRIQPEKSRKINVENTLALAKQISQTGAALFFPSSNLVFDGLSPFQKTTDPVSPRCEYGRQKVETEHGLINLTAKTTIVRFTKIISPGMALIRNWITDLRQDKTIHPFSDMVLSPVSLRFVTEAIIAIIQRESYGLWQVSASEDVTYEQMARYLAQKMGISQKKIEPIKVDQSGLKFETLPEHTTLDTTRLKEELGIEPTTVWNMLDEVLQGNDSDSLVHER
jgi:dTDP-4-dehydrorhamnose reductase